MKEAIARNQVFLDAVIEFQDRNSPFPIDQDGPVGAPGAGPSRTSARQVDKLNTTLHQCMRDWSQEGEEERRQSYSPVIEELERLCPLNPDLKGTQTVLVPGAGLGRLMLEIVARGYGCAGNEFSYFMLIVSNFILNGVEKAGEFNLSPFIDNRCNTFKIDDMLRTISVPDVCSCTLLEKAGDGCDFSMAAGEWLACYQDQVATFDAVVTVFFLDTASVVIEYIEAISRLLKEGGVWINFGPLLYHWAQSSTGDTDDRYRRSVELTWEEIRHVCANFDLDIIREERRDAIYNANQRGLMRTVYNGVLCSAVKRSKAKVNGK
eukprot:jgi/Undpi1/8114/HiC_scaffold_24.g10586.m1